MNCNQMINHYKTTVPLNTNSQLILDRDCDQIEEFKIDFIRKLNHQNRI